MPNCFVVQFDGFKYRNFVLWVAYLLVPNMEITKLTLTLRMSLACQIAEQNNFLVTEWGNVQFKAILGQLFDEDPRTIAQLSNN